MRPRELEQNRVGLRTLLSSAGGGVGGGAGRGAGLGGPHRGGLGAPPRLGTGAHLPVTLAALYLAAEMGPAFWCLFQPVGTVLPGPPSRTQGLCLLLFLPFIGKMQTEQIPQGPWVSARWPWGRVSYYPHPVHVWVLLLSAPQFPSIFLVSMATPPLLASLVVHLLHRVEL